MTKLTHASSLRLIQDRLKKRGDMPIFSASVNRIHKVGSDPDADAMALSVEILKDANLTAKVLRLANSPIYNRGQGKIGQLSRAVVILGFETVKGVVLTLKLIDSFKHEHPNINMTSLLVNSFLSGAFVRGLSARCGMRDIEQIYICGLLHNLGEIISACILPDEYIEIQKQSQEKKLLPVEAEKMVLGTSLRTLGMDIARDWEFPLGVVSTMEEYVPGKEKRIRNQADLTGALVSLANKTMGLLYADNTDSDYSLAELTFELSKVAGIKKEEVTAALEQSFKESCQLAEAYGLDKEVLAPKLRDNNDEALDKLARQFSFYAKSEVGTLEQESGEEKKPASQIDGVVANQKDNQEAAQDVIQDKNLVAGGDTNVLLEILFEITTLISQKGNFNSILEKVLEGMQQGVGFDRVVLCLLSPDHKSYTGRMAVGKGAEAIREYINFPVNIQSDLFSKIILEGSELLVKDIDQGWRQQLPADFEAKTGARSFILGTLQSKTRPLGVFYADKANSGAEISSVDSRSFMQLLAQAQLALQVR